MDNIFITILLLIIGFILLIIEVTIIPGFGFFGIAGLACLAAGCYIAMKLSLAAGIIASVLSLLVVVIIIKNIQKTKFWKKVCLDKEEAGFKVGEKSLQNYIDKTGEALTPLRPSGTVLINGKRIDVITEGLFIEKGSKVRVIKIEGNKVIVRKD